MTQPKLNPDPFGPPISSHGNTLIGMVHEICEKYADIEARLATAEADSIELRQLLIEAHGRMGNTAWPSLAARIARVIYKAVEGASPASDCPIPEP